MTRHWVWLLISVAVVFYGTTQFANTIISGEWDPWYLVFGPLSALLWAPTANDHFEAILDLAEKRRAERRKDGDDE